MRRSPGSVAACAALVGCFFVFAPTAGAATFNVTTTLDPVPDGCEVGTCSLREAIDKANNTAGDDTVALPAGRYRLTESITVDSDVVTVAGAGLRSTVIDADGNDRAFTVLNAGLELTDLTIAGGNVGDCEGAGGGGVVVDGDNSFLDATDVRFTQNQIRGAGGAIAVFYGDVTLTRVEADHNRACHDGGALFNYNGSVHISDSWLHANKAENVGGAITNVGEPTFEDSCGDIVVAAECPGSADSESVLGVQEVPGDGTLVIEDTTISDNFASYDFGEFSQGGGAIATWVFSDFTSTFVNGDPVLPAPPEVNVEIVNTTISGNTAHFGEGGGIFVGAGGVALTNDTITENSILEEDAGQVGGGVAVASDGPTDIQLKNTLLSDNRGNGKVDDCQPGNGLLTDLGNNLSSDDSCGFPDARENVDPTLGPLADNGGQTPTHQLLDGSPAIDTADNAAGPPLDQRGGDRPPAGGSAGETRDIGAYEAYSLADITVEGKGDGSDPVTVNNPLTYTVIARNNGPDRVNGVSLVDALPAGVSAGSFETSAGTCTGGYTCALGNVEPGQVVKLTLNTTPTATGTFTNIATIGALGITDPDQANNSASTTTTVLPVGAPLVVPPPQQPQQQLPQQQTPQQQTADKTLVLNVKVPKTIDVDTFMGGFNVEADCGDEACLRKFREHAAINTGASHIAGFNLTVSRTSLGFTKTKTKVKMKPCLSGATNGQRHRRCLRNLRAAAEDAAPFRVKVVVAAVDKAGNRKAKKRFIKVVP